MYRYKILRINYPGIFALKPNKWFNFKKDEEKFACLIGNIKKGLTINDPDNCIVLQNDIGLKYGIDGIKSKAACLEPVPVNKNLYFRSVVELDGAYGRDFFDKPYTELFMLFEGKSKKFTIDQIQPYLNLLFIRYNANAPFSTILKPDKSYWQESIKISEANFKSDKNFDELINQEMNKKLTFRPTSFFFAQSKYGVLPLEEKYINNNDDFLNIPEKYIDVFELFASGIMQLNYYKNYKIALLECFVAIEILVTRITDEIKKKSGVSNSKIKNYKQSIDIAYKMDVELKLFFDFDKKEENQIGKMVRARSIRNQIMHKNKPVDEKEIRDIINNIKEYLFMLINKNELFGNNN